MTSIKNIFKYRFLLTELVKKGIRLKYRRSYLGVIWSLIEPLMTTVVLVVVFGTLFNTNDSTYPLYIIIGRLVYSFFSSGTKGVLTSIRQNSAMIQKVYVPKLLYPLSSILFNFIITSISFIVLIGIQVYCKVWPTWHILQFLPAVVLMLFLTFGVGIILCTLNVFFRDIEYLWNVILLIIMYMSAIFYFPERILESKYSFILNWNPLYQVIKLSRDSFYGNPWDWNACLCAGGWSIGTIVFGLIFFSKKKDSFILHL